MKLTIFGGTGRTGQHLVLQALEKGHQVTVLVRDVSRMDVQNPDLKLIQGNVLDAAAVEQAVTGADAVLSVLGPTSNRPTFEISRGMGHIMAAMEKQGVRRLVISAGAGVGDANDAPGPANHAINFLLKLMAKNAYADMRKAVDCVRASTLDWTIVRAPMLTDSPAPEVIKVGYVGKGMGPRISRAALARFMLEQASDRTYLCQSPAVSD